MNCRIKIGPIGAGFVFSSIAEKQTDRIYISIAPMKFAYQKSHHLKSKLELSYGFLIAINFGLHGPHTPVYLFICGCVALRARVCARIHYFHT